MTPFEFDWRSCFCECKAIFSDGARKFLPCDDEHALWCEQIGNRELSHKLLEIERAKVSKKFRFTLVRYGQRGITFHRPPLVPFNAEAPNAELGFFLSESMGVTLTACSDPERYADYLANKASRGLTEKMWLEDWSGKTKGVYLFPAELVSDPSLCLPREEANQLFGIHLDSNFVAVFKSIQKGLK